MREILAFLLGGATGGIIATVAYNKRIKQLENSVQQITAELNKRKDYGPTQSVEELNKRPEVEAKVDVNDTSVEETHDKVKDLFKTTSDSSKKLVASFNDTMEEIEDAKQGYHTPVTPVDNNTSIPAHIPVVDIPHPTGGLELISEHDFMNSDNSYETVTFNPFMGHDSMCVVGDITRGQLENLYELYKKTFNEETPTTIYANHVETEMHYEIIIANPFNEEEEDWVPTDDNILIV